MPPDQDRSRSGKPGYLDYLKAAFNYRLPVRGLGRVPVNWLYVAAATGIGLAAWPMLLLGAAGEVAFLTALASNPRFQRAVRAQRRTRRGEAAEAQTDALVEPLSDAGRSRYEAFSKRCDEVLQIASRMGRAKDAALTTYGVHLAELRDVYAKLLVLIEMFSRYIRDWDKTDPAPQISAIEDELERDGLSASVRSSRAATLDILRKRAELREDIRERASVIGSEMARLEQQVALLRDQALLTRDPSVLSANMDAAAETLEEHTAWLRDNAAFLEGMEEVALG